MSVVLCGVCVSVCVSGHVELNDSESHIQQEADEDSDGNLDGIQDQQVMLTTVQHSKQQTINGT